MDGPLLVHYRLLRDAAAHVDRSGRGRIAALGPDRLSYLHAMLTNDIASLTPGTGCYAAYLTPQGRMIADMRVLELGDLTLLDVEPGVKDDVIGKLEQFIFSEDVRLADLTPQLAAIALYGPDAAGILASIVGIDAATLAALSEYQSARGTFGGATAVVASDRSLGVHGWTIYLDRDRADQLTAALQTGGAPRVSEDAAEVLRVEAARPRFGVDMDQETIPLEAGIERRAISFTKGCYPGQEVITRVLHRGHGRVARKLAGVLVDGASVPARGARVFAEDRDVGAITSAVMSPALNRPIALAYLHRDFVTPGTAVSIIDAGRLDARVTEVPFSLQPRVPSPESGTDA